MDDHHQACRSSIHGFHLCFAIDPTGSTQAYSVSKEYSELLVMPRHVSCTTIWFYTDGHVNLDVSTPIQFRC